MIWYRLSKMTFLSDLNEYLMLFLSYLQRFIAISKLVGLELCLRFMLYFLVLQIPCRWAVCNGGGGSAMGLVLLQRVLSVKCEPNCWKSCVIG